MTPVACAALQLDVQPVTPGQGAWNGTPFTVTSVPSAKVITEGSGAYAGPLQVLTAAASVTNAAAGATTPDPVAYPIVIPPGSSRCLVGALAVMLEGDFVDHVFLPQTPAGVPVPTVMRVSISDAGQSSVLTS